MLRLSRTWAFQKCSHRRSTSPTSHQRHRRRITSTEDQISQLPDLISGLPDEILVKILSLLSVKEAVTMSILSHRWRHLWTFFTGDLDFDARVLYRREYGFEYRSLEYIDLVNHVLGVHQGHKIDNLKIWFGIDSRYSNHVDSWIKFAIEKRVNGLELDFTDRIRYQDTEYYSFPELGKLVSMSSSNASFSCLSSLALINIHVTDSVVSHFLANCPCLEVLRVVHSNHLEYLNISGPSLKLKYLEIFRCDALKSLEISATNLKFLAYSGPKENIHLTSVPLLSELSLGDDYCESFAYEAHHPRHSIYLSQLVKLTLLLPYDVCRFAPRFPKQFPLLGNLEELELQIMLENGNSMFAFLSLIKASPSLSKFKMLISEGCPLTERWMLMVAQSWELHRKVARHRHEGLKVVELSGFLGYRADFELAEELLHIAVSLEKLVIDTRRAWSLRLFYEAIERGYDEENTVIEARKMRAREIGAKVPPGVEFVIL